MAVDNDTYAVTLMIMHAVGGSTVSVKAIAGESPSSEELSFQVLLLWFWGDCFLRRAAQSRILGDDYYVRKSLGCRVT